MATDCLSCRFFDRSSQSVGLCRRSSPAVASGGDDRFPSANWPLVANDDWCGEHQPAKPDRAASIESLASLLEPFLAVADALAADGGEQLFQLDLRDDEDDPVTLHSDDFHNLAAAWEAVRGAG